MITAAVPADLGPAPEEIPSDPLQIVEMRPGRPALNELHTEFLSRLDGYMPGSGRVDAIYPGPDGNLFIISWQSDDPAMGIGRCSTAVSPDAIPRGWSCGGTPPEEAHDLNSYSYSSGPGEQMVMVEHSRDVEATVIELADGDSVVIFPNGGPISYHEWEGSSPVRFTIFWDDGTTTSEILTQ